MKDLKYQYLSNEYEVKIKKGLLKVGDKMPSLRQVCVEKSVSMTTAQLVYGILESKGLIFSKPKSGFIVSSWHNKAIIQPETTNPLRNVMNFQPREAGLNIYNTIHQKNIIQLSLGLPAATFLPISALNKCIRKALNTLETCGIQYDPIEGNPKLRNQIAKRALQWQGNISADEIITTSGCISALSYCLQGITKAGDFIAVESPVYYGILQLAEHLRLNVIELPTNPQTGINLHSFEDLLQKQKVSAVVVVSNFSNPLGYCMPDDGKEKLVQIITKYDVPLIEDDIYGDLCFDNQRPVNCKTFDKKGMVLLCGSVSKTLAPGYRVGWVLPGKFKNEVLKTKAIHHLSDTGITHQAVALFFESGKYEKHLRKLRQELFLNQLKLTKSILQYFPANTKITQPNGGLFLWVELDKTINTFKLYQQSIQKNIAITPGIAFSSQEQYTNCIRLSYALEWNDKVENAIKTLGMLLSSSEM